MRVIICGAGRVGYGLAERLSQERNTVTVIDTSPDLIRQITNELDVRGVIGHGSHPDVLVRAGIRDCDMIIAVTYADEVNMMACQVAHSLFDVPTKVARVRAQGYLDNQWNDLYSRENMPIDIIISPEIEIGKAILRRLNTPGAFNVVPFGDGAVQLLGVEIEEDCPIIQTPIRQIPDLFTGLHAAIVGIEREGELFAPTLDDPLEVGDRAYIITQRVIESDKKRAENAAERLSRTVILNGDAMDSEIHEEAGVPKAEMVVCLTNNDSVNILSAVLASKLGARTTISLINELSMQEMQSELGIDMIIDPRASTISSILRHVRRGRILEVYSLEQGGAEVIEGEVLDTSPMAGKALGDVAMSEGVAIGAILAEGEVFFPSPDFVLRPGHRVVLMAEKGALDSIMTMFRVSSDYY